MIKVLPTVINGEKGKVFITSDFIQHDTLEEAEWHEFIVSELKVDALKIEFPQSNWAMTFKNMEDLKRYLDGEYEGVELKVLTDFEKMEFPNRYVMQESEEHFGVENRLVRYTISFIEMNEFKRMMINKIMSL